MAENTENTKAPEETTENTETEQAAEETREAEAAAENENGAEAEAESEKEAGKTPEAEKKADPKDEKIAALTDRMQRTMAEFDNFRKRTEKEKAAQFEMGARSVIERILPIVDNFERGLAGVPEEQKEDPFVAGMDKVYRQMLSELDSIGVKPIEAVGQPFDPNRHNAVMHVEDENVGENMVVAEFQKGYTYRDSVVRYSMVQVAN